MSRDSLMPGARFPLNLRLKGDRTYLHGTDMVDAILRLAPGLTDLSVRIQQIASRPLSALVLAAKSDAEKDMVAVISGRDRGRDTVFALVETDDPPVTDRYDYDDMDVVAAALIEPENRRAQMSANARYSTVEQCVALQKALLISCIGGPGIHWYFSRLDVTRLPDRFDSLTLTVTQALGTNLVRSAVSIDGDEIGNIFFSGVKS